jgi:hypothetical protein
MNIDEKIKRELESDTPELDKILVDDEGLFSRMSGSFKGGMKYWIIMVYFLTVVVGITFLWTGYRFFISTELQDQIFWGISFIVALNMQGFLKQFLFMESNRNSIMREVKRVEVAVARLSAKVG